MYIIMKKAIKNQNKVQIVYKSINSGITSNYKVILYQKKYQEQILIKGGQIQGTYIYHMDMIKLWHK